MADINVERKGPSIWPWIVGLLVLGLLIWGLMELFGGDDDAAAEVEQAAVIDPAATAPAGGSMMPATPDTVGMAAGAAGAAGATSLAAVMGNPTAYYGQGFSPAEPLQVAEVPSDRGFWVEEGGQRLLVVLNESPQQGVGDVQGQRDQRLDINPGDRVRISQGTLQDASKPDQVVGPLDEQTRSLLQGQQVFLSANVANIQKQ